jgi:hypothetical protein
MERGSPSVRPGQQRQSWKNTEHVTGEVRSANVALSRALCIGSPGIISLSDHRQFQRIELRSRSRTPSWRVVRVDTIPFTVNEEAAGGRMRS